MTIPLQTYEGVCIARSIRASPANAIVTGNHMIHQATPHTLLLRRYTCSSGAICSWIEGTGAAWSMGLARPRETAASINFTTPKTGTPIPIANSEAARELVDHPAAP